MIDRWLIAAGYSITRSACRAPRPGFRAQRRHERLEIRTPGVWWSPRHRLGPSTRSTLRIEVISSWRSQAALAAYFLDHYRYTDRIHVIAEAGTDDETLAICARYPNVVVDRTPPGIEEAPWLARLNAIYRALRCDWVFAVDAHELLFPLPWGTNPRPAMNREHDCDLVMVELWQVRRHRTDADLDPRRPAVPQRRHGEPGAGAGIGGRGGRPLVVRGGLDGAWTGGRQTFERAGGALPELRTSPRTFGGVDWTRADVEPGPERDQHFDDPRLF